MSSDEDAEVILEGGELYNYFKKYRDDEFDVFSPTHSTSSSQKYSLISVIDLNKTAPKCNLEILKAILNSNLLLEEDAIYLYQISNELVPQNQKIISYKVIISGIIASISLYACWTFPSGVWMSLMACSAGFVFYGMKNIMKHITYKSGIYKLLNNMQDILIHIRKLIKLIQEEDSLVNTKRKVLQLKNDDNIINNYTLKRKKVEIRTICKKVVIFLHSLISLSRHLTLDLVKIEKKNCSTINNSYIALYSDEQLGLRKYNDLLNEETDLLSLVDNMKNVYIMMQSEALKVLGLNLCKCKETQGLVDVVHLYKLKSSAILVDIKNLYETHFYPKCVPKNIKCVNNNDWHLNNALNNISSSLNGLLIDSRKLHEFIEENSDDSIDINQLVGKKLQNMETDMSHLLKYLNATSQQLLMKTDTSGHQTNSSSLLECEEEVETELYCSAVGNSDFSVTGPDEVFLGYVESSENNCNESDDFEEQVKPTYHNILMDELKTTLISKREDFEKRELQALKTIEDVESYKSCTSVYNPSASPNPHKIGVKSYPSTVKEENSFPPLINKDLAVEAISLSKRWGQLNSEECFGDESDSESD